ncbi:MAG: lysophospholipid acyltransferase family protein [Alphaproteobacteria bacterium]|nr:lysophospholipid acyltransferase family protein [Alphaproteobacteria bacterium]
MIKAAAWLLARAPLGMMAAVCRLLAWVWWTLVPVRRDLAVQNLQRVFPALPPGPTLRRCVAELALGYVELLRFDRTRAPMPALEGADWIRARAAAGQGTLMLAGHGGSWDLCGLATAVQTGVPTSVIAKPPSHPGVAALVRQIRERGGLELLAPSGSMTRVYEALSEGRVVIFFLDQRHNAGLPVPFFGRPAWTAPSLAAAARRSGCPVVGVWQWREGVGRHRVRAWPPFALTGDIDQDTRTFQAFYEDRVRERPHAWLWLHDRWRSP